MGPGSSDENGEVTNVDEPPPYDRLVSLAKTDLGAAVTEAFRLSRSTADAGVRCSAAGVLVDLGAGHTEAGWVRAGLATIKLQARQEPTNAIWQYQLGTAYLALADLESGPTHLTREAVRRSRARGRRALWESAASGVGPGLCAQAWVNLGNDLLRSARYPEAYGAYQEALDASPGHPVAAGYSASTLFSWARRSGITDGNLIALAHYWARVAQSAPSHAEAIAQGSSKIFEAFPTNRADEVTPLLPGDYPEYEQFVARHRLYLTWALDGAMHPSCWDGLTPPTIRVPIDDSASPPAIFSMLNTIKSDYLLARSLAWEAMSSDEDDAHHYTDTLDYAAYGDSIARLLLATRAALDTLDRVAVAANHHFGIGLEPADVHFRNLWREPNRPRALRPVIESEIDAGNAAMYAMAEMADDLTDNGWLEGRQRFRNVATHRFVVAHVGGFPVPQPTTEANHLSVSDLDDEVVAALTVARSGILYLYGAIGHRSHRLKTPHSVTLQLPRSTIRARDL
jgi:hypothetical protein